jgi:phage gp36-like protein
MAFVSKADLYAKILQDELDEITRGDDTLVTQALRSAEAEVRGYLFDTFDVDVIFAKTGTERHDLLVDFGADIAIYLLVSRLQAGQDIADRERRYDRAVAWLKAASKTEHYNDLPRREATKQTHIVYGSLPKRNNRF